MRKIYCVYLHIKSRKDIAIAMCTRYMKKTALFWAAMVVFALIFCVTASAVTGPYTETPNHGSGDSSYIGYGNSHDSGASLDSGNNNSRVGGDGTVYDTDTDEFESDDRDTVTETEHITETETDKVTVKDDMVDDAVDDVKDDVDNMLEDDKGSTVGIVIAILIAVAVIVLIVALVPKGQ